MANKFNTLPRLYVCQELAAGTTLSFNDEQSHYLRHVLRQQNGDVVRVFNSGGEWTARLAVDKKHLVAVLDVQLRESETPAIHQLWLYAAPIRRAHFDFMIMKATELGVAGICPVVTQHCQVRDVNIERCSAIAMEAAEQSERLSIPIIAPPIALDKIVAEWSDDCLPLICAEAGAAMPIIAALEALSPSARACSRVAVIVGPEGGFTSDELDALRGLPNAVALRLGTRILRADTAALAALTCWQAWRGDWR